MNIASENPQCPFCPRQRRADMPPIARWNPRAAKFLAIRASQPPLTSRAACARHRLGRKTADRHHALTRRFARLRKELIELNTNITRLHDTHAILAPTIIASVIHHAERASSLYRTLRAAVSAGSIPDTFSSISTSLHTPNKAKSPHMGKSCLFPPQPKDFKFIYLFVVLNYIHLDTLFPYGEILPYWRHAAKGGIGDGTGGGRRSRSGASVGRRKAAEVSEESWRTWKGIRRREGKLINNASAVPTSVDGGAARGGSVDFRSIVQSRNWDTAQGDASPPRN
ncbi:hypothetical protein C8F04DRAFT_1235486 [Mycena alexandri]|uniref:Uncharacterized protein n=1 Tax=Mycena alexandri TaxID=1745969 RepID=A0AAD6STJ7_9AGAR|nr:hypothetical protein C8F04DRAFT_1235486 [Mycena alexandri]